MSFVPIDSAGSLPTAGASVELATLDFKVKPTEDRYEAAKDVAAMANGLGGTIVIGAVARGELLDRYLPLAEPTATGAQRLYEEAVRDRCRPAPVITIASIERDAGRVLAINVWPSLGQPIGVMLKPSELSRQLEGAFVYPFRVGSHTRFVFPEQMHMFVDAHFRRTAILLREATGSRVKLLGRTMSGDWFGMCTILKLDELGNSVTLGLEFDAAVKRLVLPFDYIRAIWRDGELWKIGLSGYVDEIQWLPGTEEEYAKEETVLIDVMPPARRDRERDLRVRVTAVPSGIARHPAIQRLLDGVLRRLKRRR